MPSSRILRAATAAVFALVAAIGGSAHADGPLQNVNHIIILMQENHSFDNYFGVLPYASGTPYHGGPCVSTDHSCVDGLSCTRLNDDYTCTNSNLDDDASTPVVFHDPRYCTGPDLQHNWPGSHMEANFMDPAGALASSPNDGFVLVNDAQEQIDSGESPTDDDTMGFYNEMDLPFYYGLAQHFAINDRYFCSVVGPTFPNRAYGMAATSFGHLTTNEIFPPVPNSYKPITGTIFDLLDSSAIAWKNYYSDLPTSWIFRLFGPNAVPVSDFFADAAAGMLPPVSFVDPSLAAPTENDEHPPTDIRAGQFFVSQIVNALRMSPNWNDTILLFTYDEHGGFYDHVGPPAAPQGGFLNPDGINPGQCADLSNPPASTMPGGGVQCGPGPGSSQADAAAICPGFTPTGAYPANCANFNQLGFRVPFVAVSPFSKPQYVSHTIGDHTSMLALIEKRFLSSQFLTKRDQFADTLEDMFDFTNAPSMNTSVSLAPPPSPTDPGCPFIAATTTTTETPTTTTTTTTLVAGPVGHLKCYKTTDGRARASYTLDLMAGVGGFVNELGCRLRLPAKRICVQVTKTAVQPPPPGGGPPIGPNVGAEFLAYNLKCPRQSVAPIAFHDQFGGGLFAIRTAKELLVPALPGPPNTHLKCYKTRDPRPRARYTLTTGGGFATETGCKLKARAKEVCVGVTKQHVVPAPPGGGPPAVTSAAKLISYGLKCPAQALPAVNATDQFGPGLFAPRKTTALLVPSSPSGAFLDDGSVF